MTKARKTKCSIDGCDNYVKYKKSRVCEACYQFMYYWQHRSVTDKMKHVHKLDRWSKRAHVVLVPTRVTTLKRKAG